jgi:hypothetical protein
MDILISLFHLFLYCLEGLFLLSILAAVGFVVSLILGLALGHPRGES